MWLFFGVLIFGAVAWTVAIAYHHFTKPKGKV
jgi:hypothetical protein